ncbi:MAG: chemotaxis protein CheY [Sulfuricurvum sp. PC08-66]|nr:MAG: chemotaxis protein CheY [Sulfuricurvum sp. PC08-66]
MHILIVENEIYLAQSIASKLSEQGHHCEQAATIIDALREDFFDVILLSTNVSGQDFFPVIEHYKNSIIIMMVSYISNDTISKPLQAGAKDYIMKPFMIEELIRKIDHFQSFELLKRQNKTYERYLSRTFRSHKFEESLLNEQMPFLLFSNFQKQADAFAFAYAQHKGRFLHYICLADPKALDEIDALPKNEMLYITEFQSLKKSERKTLLEHIQNRHAILSTTDNNDTEGMRLIELKSDNKIFDQSDIMSVDDYVKYVVLNYQSKYPDTELSKKLGMSRKSLWEKRRKYGINKKK